MTPNTAAVEVQAIQQNAEPLKPEIISGKPDSALSVLMVTGAYYPEISGGGLQCRGIIHALRSRMSFRVLTTASQRRLPQESVVENVPVYRVALDPKSIIQKMGAAVSITGYFFRHRNQFDLVHVHGFSQKLVPIALLCKAFRKPLCLTLQTGGHDSAAVVRSQGFWRYWSYRQAKCVSGVSRDLQQEYIQAGLPAERFRLIPNSVDVERFSPAGDSERSRLRQELGLPALSVPLILFVGFFSLEKAPDVLLDAWMESLEAAGGNSELVFIGSTQSRYFEVEGGLAEAIRQKARERGLDGRLHFIESTHEIERFYRAADCFVLSSVREGLPIALLEAMACGLPCIATRLCGVTDMLIENGVSGLLVPPRDAAALAKALVGMLSDLPKARAMGARAREGVIARFSMAQNASGYSAMYAQAMAGQPSFTKRTSLSFGYLWSQSDAAKGPASGYHAELLLGRLDLTDVTGVLLDAGCGEGIDLAAQASKAGRQVIGVEISNGGCRVSAQRTRYLPNASVVQADLCALPLSEGQFDLIYSYGVLHHLARPEAGVRELVRVLKTGGVLAVYVYEDFSGRSFFWRFFLRIANSLRSVTTRMPHRVLYLCCAVLSPFVYLLLSAPARLMARLAPLRHVAQSIPFRHARSLGGLTGDLYDRFSAPVEFRYSKQEAEQLLEGAGLRVERVVYERGWMLAAVKRDGHG